MRSFVGAGGVFDYAQGRFFATEGTENTEFLKRRRFFGFCCRLREKFEQNLELNL